MGSSTRIFLSIDCVGQLWPLMFGRTIMIPIPLLEMIKERDLQWQGKVDNANNLIASQKEVIDDSDRLIKGLESQVKTDSLLLLKKSEQIEILKERDEANQKMIKLVKPRIWEHRYLWFAIGIYLGKLL